MHRRLSRGSGSCRERRHDRPGSRKPLWALRSTELRIPPPPLQERTSPICWHFGSRVTARQRARLSSTSVSERLLWRRFIPPSFPPDRVAASPTTC
jgi:hypothetical protein